MTLNFAILLIIVMPVQLKKYQCAQCNRSYLKKSGLLSHLRFSLPCQQAVEMKKRRGYSLSRPTICFNPMYVQETLTDDLPEEWYIEPSAEDLQALEESGCQVHNSFPSPSPDVYINNPSASCDSPRRVNPEVDEAKIY